ncbi:chromosome partition protein MukE [Thiobacillus sp.]|uniref:chromosome partition protein MukE n=1 Tax=Thiobacillus sp. TaxID=924 RepID=UPI00092B3BC2|nr:chromosome partition protein MukE [Thiobacillus sp.]OJW35402.1 MAG: hypothetical protein BGO61_06245 [Thiobacillus sp. 65-69]MBC2731172.1 hypothetical protein [Thiobacillus sp.]MBC2739909.1 chromosome partition protein MukE [Thiobacillus sp.]MBC2758904.1 chromosome partition protein MukE [Thiobacillus sp.]MBN8758868.1 chromosome partition protein MukE [Thiobacillus sp.]
MNYLDRHFVDADLILRRGGHINRSNLSLYQFLIDNFDDFKTFYQGYQCELVQHSDGFFFLLSKGGLIPCRILPKTCVHLGMFIALKTRDPEITRSSGRISLFNLMQSIETSVPRETLQLVYAPKQRESTSDNRIAEEIRKALKTLADLRFIELQGDTIKPLEAINRFAELARHDNNPDEMSRLVLTEHKGVVFQAYEEESEEEVDEDRDENEGTD